jgi:lysophospholipase L1-like esterase
MAMSLNDRQNAYELDAVDGREFLFKNVLEKPFEISGFYWLWQDRLFCRLPQSLLPSLSEGLGTHAWHTSGGRVRFRSNSGYIAIKAEVNPADTLDTTFRAGATGFDFYLSRNNQRFFRNFFALYGKDKVEGSMETSCRDEMQEWTLYLPLWCGIKRILIGIEADSTLEPPSQYSISKPLIFYGSSITQGGCAGRPGNSYPSLISRRLDADFLNFGFGASAKGEPEMAHLLGGIDASAFIMDYDHNAPDADYLSRTHEAFYKIIRDLRPSMPVIFVTKPDAQYDSDAPTRRDIIKETWRRALARGENVFFIDGGTLYGGDNPDACTIDCCHPNDLGFMRMAQGIYPVIREALNTIRK